MKAWNSLKRWTDAFMASGITRGKAIVVLPMLPVIPIGIIGGQDLVRQSVVPLVIATVLWWAFIGWRGFRLMKASGIRGDRHYDRVGKLKLAKEYRDTLSATGSKKMNHG